MDALFDGIELSHDIEISRREFAEGKGVPCDVLLSRMVEIIKGWMREAQGGTFVVSTELQDTDLRAVVARRSVRAGDGGKPMAQSPSGVR